MADSERIRLTSSDLFKEYPLLSEWFSDPKNTTAQLKDGNRLMSAREKLDYIGGENQVKQNLDSISHGWKDPYLILLACRKDAMVGHEIIQFAEIVGRRLSIAKMYLTIADLMEEGELNSIEGLTYIMRLGYTPNSFELSENRSGYLTTEQGLRLMAKNLLKRENRGLLGRLLPAPTNS